MYMYHILPHLPKGIHSLYKKTLWKGTYTEQMLEMLHYLPSQLQIHLAQTIIYSTCCSS